MRFALLFVLVCCCQFSAAQSLDSWTWRNPLPQGNALRGLAYGGGLWMMVGDNGVMLGGSGTSLAARSSGVTETLPDIAYGAGRWLAVASGGRLLVSEDGVSWRLMTVSATTEFTSLLYNNSVFLLIGHFSSGGTPLFVSSDGLSWSQVQSPGIYAYVGSATVCGGSFYLHSSDSSSGIVSVSANGTTWTHKSSPYFGNLACMGSTLVGAGVKFGTSADGGASWTVAADYSNARQLACSATSCVAATDSAMLYSSNATTWTASSASLTGDGINRMAYDGGVFMAIGNGQFVVGGSGWDGSKWTSVILTSPDGLTWTPQTFGNDFSITSVTFGNGVFLALAGTVYSSTDGKTWSQASTVSANKVRFSGGQFLIPSYSGQLASSTDARSWVAHQLPASSTMYDFAWGKDGFVAVGDGGAILQGERAAACYQVTPTTAPALSQGSSGVVTLTQGAGSSCQWTASTQSPWLAVTPATGTGSGSLGWQASTANTCTHARYDTIEAAGERIAITQPPSDSDRVFNWVEALFPTYLKPAGAASQSANSFYLRLYPGSNQAIGTIGQDAYYYNGVSVVKLGDPLQAYLYGAIQAGF